MAMSSQWLLVPPRFVLSALLLSGVFACAPTRPTLVAPSPPATASAPVEVALWSRSIIEGIQNAQIDGNVLLFGVFNVRPTDTKAEAFDVRSGRRLWQRAGAMPTLGAPGFLAIGDRVERIDVQSGRSRWSAMPRCPKSIDGRTGELSYVAIIGGVAYVGCRGGALLAARASSGQTLATARPMYLDGYDQIVALGNDALGIGGSASGAYLHRQSAIVRQRTLSRIAVFQPNMRILGVHRGDAVVDDGCCATPHSDSSPGTIDFVSLRTGEATAFAILHPYSQPLPRDRDLPLSETAFQVGDTLYVPTHTALFAYNLNHLDRQPQLLYDDLADVPMPPAGRYLTVREGAPGHVSKTSILDTAVGMRTIWTDHGDVAFTSQQAQTTTLHVPQNGRAYPIIVDRGCTLAAQSATYAFMVCETPSVPTTANLGPLATPLTIGTITLTPETIAIYKLKNP